MNSHELDMAFQKIYFCIVKPLNSNIMDNIHKDDNGNWATDPHDADILIKLIIDIFKKK